MRSRRIVGVSDREHLFKLTAIDCFDHREEHLLGQVRHESRGKAPEDQGGGNYLVRLRAPPGSKLWTPRESLQRVDDIDAWVHSSVSAHVTLTDHVTGFARPVLNRDILMSVAAMSGQALTGHARRTLPGQALPDNAGDGSRTWLTSDGLLMVATPAKLGPTAASPSVSSTSKRVEHFIHEGAHSAFASTTCRLSLSL